MRTEHEIEIEDDDEVEIVSRTPAWVSGAEGFETHEVPGTDLGDAPQLENLAKTIRECHAACQATFQSAVLRAKEAGELLIQVKECLGHGEFSRWVDGNCGFSRETARLHACRSQVARTGVCRFGSATRYRYELPRRARTPLKASIQVIG